MSLSPQPEQMRLLLRPSAVTSLSPLMSSGQGKQRDVNDVNAKHVGFNVSFGMVKINFSPHNYSKMREDLVFMETLPYLTRPLKTHERFIEEFFLLVLFKMVWLHHVDSGKFLFLLVVFCQPEGMSKINLSACPGCVAC